MPELLDILKAVLAEDDLGTIFDWLGLWVSCYQAVQSLKTNCAEHLAHLTSGRIDLTCYEIAHEMLWEAADSRTHRGSTLLAALSTVLQGPIEKASDTYLKLFKDLSSGHISARSRPCDKWAYGQATAIVCDDSIGPDSDDHDAVSPPAPDSPDVLRRIRTAMAVADDHYRNNLRHNASLSHRGRTARATRYFDQQLKLAGLPKRAVSCRLNEAGATIYNYYDVSTGLPEDLVYVCVNDVMQSVRVTQQEVDEEIADMRPECRPKDADQRQELQEQMGVDRADPAIGVRMAEELASKRDKIKAFDNGLQRQQQLKPRTDRETLERAMKRFWKCDEVKSYSTGDGEERIWVKDPTKLAKEAAQSRAPRVLRLSDEDLAGETTDEELVRVARMLEVAKKEAKGVGKSGER